MVSVSVCIATLKLWITARCASRLQCRSVHQSVSAGPVKPPIPPITPPRINRYIRRKSRLPRTEWIDSSCPTSEPNTTMGPASCGLTDHAQIPIAANPKAKPESPCTKPATAAPTIT